jgi:uncharacterized phage protein gp47/JayE
MNIDETFEDIMEEMLREVPNSYDKRVGGIIYNALAPVALKIISKNKEINNVENQVFPDTATGKYLDKKAAEEGLKRKEARAAKREAIFEPFIPPIGTRFFTTDGLFWKLIESNIVECESVGYIGNTTLIEDNLVPIDYVEGLEKAILGDVEVFGSNIESDEDFRIRLFEEYQDKKNNSNKAQIKAWAKEIQGVGDAKVVSLWDGPNTVKVIIVDEERLPAQQSLVEEVQQYLDPIEYLGEGEGMADIGTIVTAVSAEPLDINISVKVKSFPENLSKIKEIFENLLNEYRKQIVFIEDIIKYNYIGSLLMGIKEVEDYKELKLNDTLSNLNIPNESIPIFTNIEVLPYE